MTADQGSGDFLLTIDDVVTVPGRGTLVVGAVAHGDVRTGDVVELWDHDQLVTRARVALEQVCLRPGDGSSIGLRLPHVDRGLLSPGQTIRRPASA